MIFLSFLPKNNELKEKEEKKNENKSNINKTNFNAFNSALFISEFQDKEENSSEIINKENINDLSNSNKIKESSNNNNINLNFSYSLEKCLTNELLDTIDKDSNDTKKYKISKEEKEKKIENNFNMKSTNKTNIQEFLKIKKNLLYQPNTTTREKNNNIFKLNGYNKKTIYEENINGFDYQLKFIEDSLHNVLPKSYKKIQNNMNNYNNYNYSCFTNNRRYFYNNKKGQKISPFIYPNKFNNINNNNYNSSFYENESNNNKYGYVSPFDSEFNNDESPFINSSINNNINANNNGVCFNDNKIKYQIHQLNVSNIKNFEWKCNYCNYINMGYRKTCLNCRNNKKAKF